MSVSSETTVAAADYVPYHTASRGAPDGMVGFLSVDAEVTGAAGGGTAQVTLLAGREVLGFPWTWVPTNIGSQDNLATAEEVAFRYIAAGNRMLTTDIRETQLAIQSNVTNVAKKVDVALPIEPDSLVAVAIFVLNWPTNVDTKVYHLHMAGPVFDMQWIAKQGAISPLLAGIR